jgi:enoyl-CoA hydratase
MPLQHLLVERDGGVLTIVLNRPRVLNALNAEMISELDAAIADADRDTVIGAVVITGSGDRAFAAGADVKELSEDSPAGACERARRTQAVFARIEQLGKPVIAAVNGVALGGGCELAMSCTLRLAAITARFGQPEINLGLIPGYGGSHRLPRLVGRGRALELLLTGDAISAEEAWRIGLVNRVLPSADLLQAARELGATLAAKPRQAVRHLLEAVRSGLAMTPEAADEHEATLFGAVFGTSDMREGTSAFLAKRTPVFKGT